MFLILKCKNNVSFNINYDTIFLKKDEEYIIPNGWLEFITNKNEVETYPVNIKQYNIKYDLNNKKLLFIRSYALGDVLILSGLINYIKEVYPSAVIDFAVPDSHKPLVKYLKCVDNHVTFPIKKEIFDSYDYHFTVIGLVENNKTKENIYDLYFKELGCNPIIVDEKFKRPYSIECNRRTNDYIGFHPFANAKIRSYPYNLIDYLVNQLYIMFNKKVVLFADEKQYNSLKYSINPSTTIWSYSSIDETKNILERCQFVISVDSFITHFCQSLNIPTIALYGSFPYESRLKYYKNIKIIDTCPECRCMSHKDECPKLYRPIPCMNIHPEFILNTIIGHDMTNKPNVRIETYVNE